MATCGSALYACVRHLMRPEEKHAVVDAEKEADKQGAVFASNVVEAQHALDEALRQGTAALAAVRAAKVQGNAVAQARAQAQARTCSARVRELRARIDTNTQLQYSCERAAMGLREARQYHSTVDTLTAVQRQFKTLRMGTLMESAEGAMADMGATDEKLGDIRHLLATPLSSEPADLDADMRELEALLALEQGDTVAPKPAPADLSAIVFAAPAPSLMTKRSKLPTAEAYAAALQNAS